MGYSSIRQKYIDNKNPFVPLKEKMPENRIRRFLASIMNKHILERLVYEDAQRCVLATSRYPRFIVVTEVLLKVVQKTGDKRLPQHMKWQLFFCSERYNTKENGIAEGVSIMIRFPIPIPWNTNLDFPQWLLNILGEWPFFLSVKKSAF